MKFKKSALLLCSLIAVFSLSGCMPHTPSTFLPQGGHRYISLTSSSSRQDAYNWAIKNATSKCKKMGKQIRVVKATNKYNGPTQQQKMTAGIVGSITAAVSHGRMFGGGSGESDDDNQVRLTFKCVH